MPSSLGSIIVDIAANTSQLKTDLDGARKQLSMFQKNVDLIIWDGGPVYSNFWINQAQKIGYNPRYSFDEQASGGDDFSIQTVQGQIDGWAWGVRRRADRRTDAPTAPSDAACTQTASQGSGITMPRSSDLYWNTVSYCGQLSAFVDAANAAAPNPTRTGFAAALANLGQRPDLESGPAGVGGSWVPGKPDAADYLREMRHDLSCRCWRPTGDWFPMRLLGG